MLLSLTPHMIILFPDFTGISPQMDLLLVHNTHEPMIL
jgi:hypothetical protein